MTSVIERDVLQSREVSISLGTNRMGYILWSITTALVALVLYMQWMNRCDIKNIKANLAALSRPSIGTATPAIATVHALSVPQSKPAAPPKDPVPPLALAAVPKGGGIQSALVAQLVATPPILNSTKFEFKGNIDNRAAVKRWAENTVPRITIGAKLTDPIHGYELRVIKAGVAYLLRKDEYNNLQVVLVDGKQQWVRAVSQRYQQEDFIGEEHQIKPIPGEEYLYPPLRE